MVLPIINVHTTMLKGKIVLYDKIRRQGYVRLPDTYEEFHFRISAEDSPASLESGDWVSFVIARGKQGYVAKNIKLLNLM